MRDRQAGNEDLLSLRVPCESSTETLEQLAACMYGGGSMKMNAELLVPMLQLGDGIQVGQGNLHRVMMLRRCCRHLRIDTFTVA